jgi:uncharacterized protein
MRKETDGCTETVDRSMIKVIRWRDHTGRGLEHFGVRSLPDAIRAESVVVYGEQLEACSYIVECDLNWRFRRATIEVLGGRRMELALSPADGWTRDGVSLRGFGEAKEIDFVATPFTNTLPIRRLGLVPGQSADIVTAWIDFPSLEISPDRQRYTCLRQNLYRYEALDGSFTREIEVDDDGFVVDYPGLFARA